jgi:hypothetical protein
MSIVADALAVRNYNPHTSWRAASKNVPPAKPDSNSHPVRNHGRGGARHRQKGDRIEREIVRRHIALGIRSERYPLSGASRFRGSGHDIDLYIFGEDEAPLVTEVKSRNRGSGFVTIENWLGDYDALILRRNKSDPLVCVPWRVWARLLQRVCR